MNKNLNTNDDYYIDDEYNEDVEFEVAKEKKNFNPKIFLIPAGILVAILLFVIVFRAISNNVSLELSDLYIEGIDLDPKFKSSVYKYTSNTEDEEVYIACKAKSKKANVKGCNLDLELKTGLNTHEITLSYEKKKKVYKIEIIREVNIEFEVTGNAEDWTSNAVTLKVEATTEQPLHKEAYSFDGGETWQTQSTKQFTENKEVKILVRDEEENVSEEQVVVIDKIDMTVPKVSISKDGTMLTATISPSTTESEYTYQWYKNNKIISGATSLVYKTNGDGVYKLVVRTGAGKTGEKTYTIKTEKPKPTTPTQPTKPNSGNSTTKPTNPSGGNSGSTQKPATDPSKVSGVKLDKTNITMKAGSTTLLSATVSPSTATNKGLVWQSSDNSIATVSQTGQIRAKKRGTVIITVYTQEGNKKATCTVTIN